VTERVKVQLVSAAVLTAPELEKVINAFAQAAKALGVTVPLRFPATADEVTE
jgi:hypothetical protein